MYSKIYILNLCEKFKNKECNLKEFQSRIETSIFPEKLEEFKQIILNDIENIVFTELEVDFYFKGLKVVNMIVKEMEYFE